MYVFCSLGYIFSLALRGAPSTPASVQDNSSFSGIVKDKSFCMKTCFISGNDGRFVVSGCLYVRE